jgi:hypothetical protein
MLLPREVILPEPKEEEEVGEKSPINRRVMNKNSIKCKYVFHLSLSPPSHHPIRRTYFLLKFVICVTTTVLGFGCLLVVVREIMLRGR